MRPCGWGRSIWVSAVVPLLGWPTTKKSGTRAPGARAGSAVSVKVLIAPQRDEVAADVLPERGDLVLVAAPQLAHELLVRRRGLAVDDLALERVVQAPAHGLGRERAARAAQRAEHRPAAGFQGAPGAIDTSRA